MGFKDFIFCTRHGMFDVRHYMVSGCCIMTAACIFISQSALQARVLDPGVHLTENTRPARHDLTTALPPKYVKLSMFGDRTAGGETERFTHLASLGTDAPVTEYSPKNKESCSLDAAKAAAKGDTTKITPCITAMLSGDAEQIAMMPENMAKFFIETMDDPDRVKNAPQILINSMMAMMEAMTGKTEPPAKMASVK